MKKRFALALALVLALSISAAFAADDPQSIIINPDNSATRQPVQVTFSVDPTYTITIPATVTLAKDPFTGNYRQDATIEAENVRLLEGKALEVSLASASGFKLSTNASGATYELPYTVTIGSAATSIAEDGVVATFATQTGVQTETLHFAADNPTYAGAYSDTVTFTIATISTISPAPQSLDE